MSTSAHRNRRSRQRARQTSRKPRSPRRLGPSIHQRAISRLSLELRATEGLHCWFHSGVSWRAYQHLIERGSSVIVEAERELRVAGRRFIPDLTLRCPKSGEILLLVEVWHTHAVSVAKRRAFAAQGLPWIEVRASNHDDAMQHIEQRADRFHVVEWWNDDWNSASRFNGVKVTG